VLLLLPPPSPAIHRFLHPLFPLASLSLSIHLPYPFPILSVSSTREGRIADVFTIVVSLDRKLRRGCRYRACFLSLSLSFFLFLSFALSLFPRPSFLPRPFSSLPSILSWSFLIVARGEREKERESKAAEVVIPRFSIFVTIARPLPSARSRSFHRALLE